MEGITKIQTKIRRGEAPTIDEINANWKYIDTKTKNDGYRAFNKLMMVYIREHCVIGSMIYRGPSGLDLDKTFLAEYSKLNIPMANQTTIEFFKNEVRCGYWKAPPISQLYILRHGIFRREINEVRSFNAIKRIESISFRMDCCAKINGEKKLMNHFFSTRHLEAVWHKYLLSFKAKLNG